MTKVKHWIAGAGIVLAIAACTDLPYAPVDYTSGLMTGRNGMTLYTFDKDATGSGKSVCNGPCAINWPPLAASSTDRSGGDWTVITRDDGSKQWAWHGKPLYFWAKDQKPGDVTGDGFNKVWRAVRPDPRDISAGNMNGP